MLQRLKKIALAWLILFLASGCTSFPSIAFDGDLQHGWQRANLLLVKDPGSLDPEHAIIALYLRQRQGELEFRLDLLAMQNPLSNEIILALDVQPGGSNKLPSGAEAGLEWDVLIVGPVSEPPYALTAGGRRVQSLAPRIIRDPQLQTVIVAVNPAFLPGDPNRLRVQAFLADPASGKIFDQTSAARPGDPSPAAAPLLLAFTDALPAATPVQALRRWDGAHTGPMGRRHGLSILVNEATSRSIPITLLDLKTPESLSALDLLGGTKWLKKVEVSGLVILPLVGLADAAGSMAAMDQSTRSTSAFGFRTSQLGYGAFDPNALPQLKAFFAAAPGVQHLVRWQRRLFIPLPSKKQRGQPEADENGPTLDFKKQLIRIALSPEADLMIVGGSMPASILADSAAAPLFFEYLATHPWIEPLSETSLLAFPAQEAARWPFPGCTNLLCLAEPDVAPYTSQGQVVPSGLTAAQIQEQIRSQLAGLPGSTIKDQAWQAYARLTSPEHADVAPAIQANYIGQIGYLVAAARWAQHPAAETDCSRDIDWDGLPECILANNDIFSVIKLDGGRLAFMGRRAGRDVQQWIGQKSQFSINWDLAGEMNVKAGPGSDLDEIPGAFFDPLAYTPLTPSTSPGEIRLSSPEASRQRTFALESDRIRISIQSAGASETRIPIVMDAPGRLHPGWIDSYPAPQQSANSWSWQPTDAVGIQVIVKGATLNASTFLDSLPFMLQPEIPDRTYPAGHYLPFPLAVLTLDAAGSYSVEIRF